MMATMLKEALFGGRLTEVMERQGITKYRLSKLTGLNESYIGKVLRGDVGVSPAFVETIAPHVGIPLEELKAWADVDAIGMDGVERIKRYVLGITQQIHEDADQLRALKAERASLMAGPITPEVERRICEVDIAIADHRKAIRMGASSLSQSSGDLAAEATKLPQDEREMLEWLRQFTPDQRANIRRLTPAQAEVLGHFLGR